MKIFVAGATGVLGRRTVTQLLAARHDVTSVARTAAKAAAAADLGATPAEVSLFDRDALVAAVAGHDVVLNLATAIPTGEHAADLAAWDTNHRIRREASANLVEAALAASARRYVQESITLLYAAGGDGTLDESAPVDATWVTVSALDAEDQAHRFAARGAVGIVLRFGMFYGSDSAHTLEAVGAARAGVAFELGPEFAFRSSITTDDAAAAVVAALDAPSGVYNVTDDRPLRRDEFVDAAIAALGVERPVPPTLDVELPPEFSMLARSQRVSNDRFKALTGWRPASPSAWEGWRSVLAELGDRVAG